MADSTGLNTPAPPNIPNLGTNPLVDPVLNPGGPTGTAVPAPSPLTTIINSGNVSDPNILGAGVVNAAATEFGQGENLLGTATNALDPYLENLEKIYGGDRAANLQASAPEVAQVSSQYDAAYQAALNNAPRGGGRNATLTSIPFQKASAVQNVLQTNQQQAGAQLGTVGAQIAGLGLNAETGGTGALTNVLGSFLGQSENNENNLFGALGSIGALIGTALTFGAGAPALIATAGAGG